MSDQDHNNTNATEQSAGLSRRSALKLGVAAGVGAAAWSGSQITSVAYANGPAYGCTFFERVELEGCRNTDQASETDFFRYHEVKNVNFPSDEYAIIKPIEEGTACGTPGTAETFIIQHPEGLECQVKLEFWDPSGGGAPGPCKVLLHTTVMPDTDSDPGTATIELLCPDFVPDHPGWSSVKYKLVLECATDLESADC